MKVLRDNKDSLMAMLEAFVHDPLINWRLLGTTTVNSDNHHSSSVINTSEENVKEMVPEEHDDDDDDVVENSNDTADMAKKDLNLTETYHDRNRREMMVSKAMEEATKGLGEAPVEEQLNSRALEITQRILDKLTGRDFENDHVLNVPNQVDRLIHQATASENLSQCYLGWCPFW